MCLVVRCLLCAVRLQEMDKPNMSIGHSLFMVLVDFNSSNDFCPAKAGLALGAIPTSSDVFTILTSAVDVGRDT